MRKRTAATLACLCSGLLAGALAVDTQPQGVEAAASGASRPANRLLDSADPYLLLHAHNPVDWYPWGPEALEKARRENKPIFISVGYSTCYWCHVAERTIYSDPNIAKLMNQWFVNIKIDREERPDLDEIYMLATQLMTGQGGWPNIVFLTPELKPFHGGSYFPPADDEFGRPGFTTILRTLHEEWTAHPERLRERADLVAAAMRNIQEQRESVGAGTPQPENVLAQARDAFLKHLDTKYGGFRFGDDAAKFPHEPVLDLLIADYRANRTEASLGALTRTLDAMAAGGIYDQLGGGFHRYSIEPTWSVPHFEKMLCDNAQLLKIYAEAYQLTREPRYRRIALQVAEYLQRRLMAPEGGFYTAEDAAVGTIEGASYLWSREEIAAALGAPDADRLLAVFALTPMNQPFAGTELSEQGVLRLRQPQTQREETESRAAISALLARLLGARERRPQPARDEKMVVALNGLAIEALARSSSILRQPHFLDLARRAAERIWALAYDEKTDELRHQVFRGQAKGAAFLDDYALFGRGCVALFDASGDNVWLARAARLADDILRRYALLDGGLRTSTADRDLLLPLRETGESVYPAGLSAAVDLLQRLAEVKPRYRERAQPILRHAAMQVAARPESWPFLASVLRGRVADHRPRTADTAAHVRVSAVAARQKDYDEVIVTVAVDAGFHIHANPASSGDLIATRLSLEGVRPLGVRYPAPSRFHSAFSPETLDVYEGIVRLVARLPKGTLLPRRAIRGVVRAQACDDRSCFAPADLPIVIQVE